MPAEFWVIFLILTGLVAATGGYAAARRRAPKRSELEALRRELDAARKQADEVQTNVTSHFEQSAVLFGQLARDYRAFLQHFSESAQDLGISEARARELLERADRPLLAKSSEIIDADAEAAAGAAVGRETGRTAEPETATATAGDEPESTEAAVVADLVDPTVQVAEAQAPEDADRASAGAPADAPVVPEATEGTASPEPPLIDDVVKPGRPAPAGDADETVAQSRVVDVDIDALGLEVPEQDKLRSDDGSDPERPARKRVDGA